MRNTRLWLPLLAVLVSLAWLPASAQQDEAEEQDSEMQSEEQTEAAAATDDTADEEEVTRSVRIEDVEDFIPSVQISEDLSVTFPVDI